MTRHRKPGKHKPVHPGEVLRKEFLYPGGMTVEALADGIGVSREHLQKVCLGDVPLTGFVAMGLARAFGNSEQFWLGLQAQYDAEMEAQ